MSDCGDHNPRYERKAWTQNGDQKCLQKGQKSRFRFLQDQASKPLLKPVKSEKKALHYKIPARREWIFTSSRCQSNQKAAIGPRIRWQVSNLNCVCFAHTEVAPTSGQCACRQCSGTALSGRLSWVSSWTACPPSKLEVGLTGSRSATSSLDALPSGLFRWVDSFPSSSPLVLSV